MDAVRNKFITDARRETFWQLVRFGIAGGLATVCYAAVYSPLAALKITSEQVANICGYLVAMLSGYVLHSKWSFRGHGTSATASAPKFFAVSLVSYAVNTLWVFLLTDDAMMAGPWWWPLVPIVFVTPLVTFALNRLWVFA
ncbi:GtrA family protein [Sphingomonas radiodurans]|uniref:GtrA family protein n=1 Tax=Sphingomonas radiodurans TaxID=2890321 RepID=UPI001E392A42|nr:GtrA family protein [Sphingomonas radiodurans]WBH17555.1 GtrA family protein [Sphingomonas radiodurans]